MSGTQIIDPRGLGTLQDELWAYAHSGADPEVCARLGQSAGGIVTRIEGTAAQLRRDGFEGGLVIDPARYDKDAAQYQQLPLVGVAQDWVHRQEDHRAAVYLSPSPYVDEGDIAGLQAVIDDGIEFCQLAAVAEHAAPCFLVIPIAKTWLTIHLDQLVVRLADAAVPVALMLGDPTDPLDTRAAVEGLVAVVTSLYATAVMRSDLSAVGAIACGAIMGSIGTLSSCRHFVQPTRRAGGVSGDKTPNVLIPPIASYVRGSKLEYIEGDGGLLSCRCPVCDGRSLTRFGQAPYAQEALFHNQHVWQSIAGQVLEESPAIRLEAWRRLCTEAIDALDELERRTGVSFPSPGYLRAWSQLA